MSFAFSIPRQRLRQRLRYVFVLCSAMRCQTLLGSRLQLLVFPYTTQGVLLRRSRLSPSFSVLVGGV